MKQYIDQQTDNVPPFDDAAQEREWLAQESALRRERLNLDRAGEDERGRPYRQLASALREPLPDGLPRDFATRVAARAATASAVHFEIVLLAMLIAALLVVAGIVVTTYGNQWTARNLQGSAWLLALAGCLGTSWLMQSWQRPGRR
jgi:hypothetical protein